MKSPNRYSTRATHPSPGGRPIEREASASEPTSADWRAVPRRSKAEECQGAAKAASSAAAIGQRMVRIGPSLLVGPQRRQHAEVLESGGVAGGLPSGGHVPEQATHDLPGPG